MPGVSGCGLVLSPSSTLMGRVSAGKTGTGQALIRRWKELLRKGRVGNEKAKDEEDHTQTKKEAGS